MKEGSPLFFVDTNILVYAFDQLEGEKHFKAVRLVKSLWETRSGCLSIQVLQEFHSAVTRPRAKAFSLKESQEIIRSFAYWEVYSPKPNDILQAISIQEKNILSFWDALIIQTAISSGCQSLYTEDFSNGRIIDGVKIINPFL